MEDPDLRAAVEMIQQQCDKYELDNIYNVDEFGLFYKCLPRRTYIAPREQKKTTRGTKRSKMKDRVTSWACTNATGTHVVACGIIGKSYEPRCFKTNGVPKHNMKNGPPPPIREHLPMPYFQQDNAWSNARVMNEWFRFVFLPHVRKHHVGQEVLLLMDNCGCHSEKAIETMFMDRRNQVKVLALPPNTTSKLQPMDAGIIAWIKRNYKYKVLDLLLDVVEE